MEELDNIDIRISKLPEEIRDEAIIRFNRIILAAKNKKKVSTWLMDLVKLLKFLKEHGV